MNKNALIQSLLALGIVALFVMQFTGSKSNTPEASPLSTENGDVLKIAYIRLDSVLSQYELHKSLTNEFELEAMKVQQKLGKQQQELQYEYQLLSQSAPNMNQAQLNNAQAEFQRIQQNYANLEKSEGAKLEAKQKELTARVQKEMDVIKEELAKELDLDYILVYESTLFYADSIYDITPELVNRLNSLPRSAEAEKK